MKTNSKVVRRSQLETVFDSMIKSLRVGAPTYSDSVKEIELLKRDRLRVMKVSNTSTDQLDTILSKLLKQVESDDSSVSIDLLNSLTEVIEEQVKLTDLLLRTL